MISKGPFQPKEFYNSTLRINADDWIPISALLMIHTWSYQTAVFHKLLTTSSVHTVIVWLRMKILLSLCLPLHFFLFILKASERPSELIVTWLVFCSCDSSPGWQVRAWKDWSDCTAGSAQWYPEAPEWWGPLTHKCFAPLSRFSKSCSYV